MLNRNNKKPAPNFLLDGDREVTDPIDISNQFCDYFSSVANNIANSIPVSNLNPMSYMPQSKPNSFFATPTTSEEVLNIIGKLENKSVNINTIPVFIYKHVGPLIAPIISDIFDSSMREGVFPKILKLARVIPIHKSKNRKVISNFRPISILSTTAKIIETIMKDRVSNFIKINNLSYSKQFGFKKGYSTSDAVLELVDRCTSALDDKLYTVAVFLDLSKAFDTVNKDIMIEKMRRLGFRGVVADWFDSYLSDRKLYVDVDGNYSATRTLNIGLPQGSVTSPYLFSLYIDDMHRSSEKLSFIHFADDTTVYMSGNDLATLCRSVNEELVKVSQWLNTNRLSLNADKTNYMIFTHKTVDPTISPIIINNSYISLVSNFKFLGITIDSRLNFNQHCNILSRKLSCAVGVIRRVSYYIPKEVLKILYFSLFYPHLIYGIPIWGGCGLTNINRVTTINNKICSIFASIYNNSFVPYPYLNVYHYFLLCTFHNLITKHNHNPYFSNKLLDLVPDHDHLTRFSNNQQLSYPNYRKATSHNQFLYNSIKNWNELPFSLREIQETTKFKKSLKKSLFSNDS